MGATSTDDDFDRVTDGVVPLSRRAVDHRNRFFELERLIQLAETRLGMRRFGRQLDPNGNRVYVRAIQEMMAGPLGPAVSAFTGKLPHQEGFQTFPGDLVALVVEDLRSRVAVIDDEINAALLKGGGL